ncbi:hypothetical protein BDW02DRAFT_558056 [Decorospora gaudefroyi]|uniref:FHA domain-containing protein n=1 Tax=Decorospora gaudefroyi TaxID=184978 RepID=A0A6A5K8T1_9PLEO|nr:hypothetical protein BDW02DRAFT_558056 [Decorospora gaudefroyi]
MIRTRLADPPVFRIVLRDLKRYDTYETREFDLPMNSTFPIGRSSKNATKRDLIPGPDNAFIDSPVISREHAELSANANSGRPEVYISDSNSMHGTFLNGHRLQPCIPSKLNYGDLLQFGSDVNRNEEYFVARTYTFESQLARPFSLGFAVPDPDSEEEDIMERRGSQTDPLVIDDSDAASDPSDEDEQAEVTMMMDQVLQQDEPTKPSAPPQDDYPDLASGGEEVDGLADFDSEAASVDSCEADYDSELEVQDSEDDEAEEADHTKPFPSSTTPKAKSAATPRDALSFEDMANTQGPLPRLDMFGQYPDSNSALSRSMFEDVSNTPAMNFRQSNDSASSLPPRASAPRSTPLRNYPFSYSQQSDSQSWYSDEMQQPSYLGTNFGDRPSLFSPAPPPPAQESVEPRAPAALFGNYTGQMLQADRLQTPPLMPTSDIEASTPPQPGRRTKVTIGEIVEEQPPTPESVNNLKRKADVLDTVDPATTILVEEALPEEAIAAVEQPPADQVVPAQVVDAAAVQTAAIIAQRPKKTPRSVLGRVLDKAAYPLLGATGAAVSFALLSTLPDTFFA